MEMQTSKGAFQTKEFLDFFTLAAVNFPELMPTGIYTGLGRSQRIRAKGSPAYQKKILLRPATFPEPMR
jgi:hypothetical protein